MRLMRLGFLVIAGVARPQVCSAQSGTGPLSAHVTIIDASQHGDTATITYRIQNDPTSTRSLQSFSVPRRVPIVSAAPRETPWLFFGHAGRRDVTKWTVIDSTVWMPGASGVDLQFSGLGVIDLTEAWIFAWRPILSEGDVAEAIAAGRSLSEAPITVTTVGILPAPAASSTQSAIVRLDSLARSSCGLGWISPSGVCNSLTQKIAAAKSSLLRADAAAARGQLNALLNELEAQRGQHVSDNAFWLLKANASFLLGQL